MKNIKHNVIILILMAMFGFTVTLNYFQHNKLVKDRNKIKSNFTINYSKRKIKKEMYSEIFKDIEEKKGIKIKNITKKNQNNLFTVDLEFKGQTILLDAFLKDIKTKENLYEVSSIKIKKEADNIYRGSLVLKFII